MLSVKIFNERETYPQKQDAYQLFIDNGGHVALGISVFVMNATHAFLSCNEIGMIEGWMQPTRRPVACMVRATRRRDPLNPLVEVLGVALRADDPLTYLDDRRGRHGR